MKKISYKNGYECMIHKLNWVLKAVQGIRDTKNRTEQQKEEYKR